MIHRSISIICVLTALVLISPFHQCPAQDPVVGREYEIKAVYLYHFCRYVEWPKNSVDSPAFVIGVLGPNVFGIHLDQLATQTVNNKKIVAHRFASIDNYKPCHILFIAPGDKAPQRLMQALEKTKASPVLLVSDTEGFGRKGVVFNFFIEENSVKFEINPAAAKRSKLRLNPQLFGLPQIKIIKESPEDN